MNFFKTSFWASLTTGLTIVCGFITTKIIAVKLGPEGIALTGQFSNFTVLIALFATAACANGVVKYISEAENPEQKQQVMQNAFVLTLYASILLSVLTLLGSYYFSIFTFKDDAYVSVYLIYGSILFFVSVNTITQAILNGMGRIREMASFSMTISLLNVVCVFGGAYLFGIKGVLLANAVANVLGFLIYLSRFKKIGIQFSFRKKNVDYNVILKLLRFSLMAVVSGVLAPLLQLFVRSKIMVDFNLGSAGVWQATTKLSDYYLNFVYSVLSIYYLPKLSGLRDHAMIRKEVYMGYLRIVPAVSILALLVWLFRDLIIHVAFTSEFNNIVHLLKWQLIGDVVKVSSFILSYLLISKGHMRAYIIIELAFACLFIILSALFIKYFGLVGSVYAFTLNYFIYMLVLIVVLRKYLFGK
jgi:O-antigen/teichoic acid export membrane protein